MPEKFTPRDRARTQTMAEIVAIARRQLLEQGAAALSLRAVARELGVVSSAIYRYVPSRDDLLTLLVVDGYTRLAEAVDAAVLAHRENHGVSDPMAEFKTLGHAVRTWGLSDPATYGLLFGTPVPGYEAPAERTNAPGTRVVLRLAEVLTMAWIDGAAVLPEGSALPDLLRSELDSLAQEFAAPPQADHMAMLFHVWAALFGLVSFEVFGQFGALNKPVAEALFDNGLLSIAAMAGLK